MTIVHIVSALSEPSPVVLELEVVPYPPPFVPLYGIELIVFPLLPPTPSFPVQEFVGNLDGLPMDAKERLLHMTPASYIGNASTQAKNIKKFL